MIKKQQTIRKAVTISGVGLHTGKPVNMTFKPAPVNHGYVFRRTDLENQPEVRVDVNNVTDVSRGTNLEENGVKIITVEHTLAALAGLEIDNILIELDNLEPPIMDGSSKMFTEALHEAGVAEQNAERRYFELKHNISFVDEAKDARFIAMPHDEFKVTVMIDYNSPVLGTQHATLSRISDFREEISPSRTFCFLHELEHLLKENLIKGGDLNNAIVVVDRVVEDDEIEHLARLFNKPKVSIRKEGILNNVELRHANEPARHKLLDVVGDLALIGMPIKGHIVAQKPGHSSNVAFARKIKKMIRDESKKTGYDYDPMALPLYDVNRIMEILPHKPPFLLIDKILEMSDRHVVGLKNVTMNEPYFQGHFPGNPVMPGVLQVEAMAQTGGIFALNSVPDPQNYWTYFLKIDNFKFKKPVVPGDTLIFKLELLTPIRRGICHMKGTALVAGQAVAEGELLAQLVKKTDR